MTARAVFCPACRAAPGEPCTSEFGGDLDGVFHTLREERVDCPKCGHRGELAAPPPGNRLACPVCGTQWRDRVWVLREVGPRAPTGRQEREREPDAAGVGCLVVLGFLALLALLAAALYVAATGGFG